MAMDIGHTDQHYVINKNYIPKRNLLRFNQYLLVVIAYLLSIPPALITDASEESPVAMRITNNYDQDDNVLSNFEIDCLQLKVGQFKCDPYDIEESTQQPYGCDETNLAPVNCTLRPGLICDENSWRILKSIATGPGDGNRRQISLATPCQYTNGYSYEITLLLSIFLGMLGIDRFYLGYFAIGLLKLFTLGFLFLGQFIDIILIAMEVVRPADGSNYIIKFFGPRLTIVERLRQPLYHIPVTNILNVTPRMVAQSEFDVFYYPPALFNISGNNESLPADIASTIFSNTTTIVNFPT